MATVRNQTLCTGLVFVSLRAEQLVALFAALQALDALCVHLLCHLLVAGLFLLGGSLVLDALNVGLVGEEVVRDHVGKQRVTSNGENEPDGGWFHRRNEQSSGYVLEMNLGKK